MGNLLLSDEEAEEEDQGTLGYESAMVTLISDVRPSISAPLCFGFKFHMGCIQRGELCVCVCISCVKVYCARVHRNVQL